MRNWYFIFIVLFVAGCRNSPDTPSSGTPEVQAYMPISHTSCLDSVGINGKWLLVNVHQDERNYPPTQKQVLVITDCSLLQYYVSDRFTKKDSFKLLRVLNYCADYQLNYINSNDSISCINMRKDTLIFGDCSTFETTRYFYKRVASH